MVHLDFFSDMEALAVAAEWIAQESSSAQARCNLFGPIWLRISVSAVLIAFADRCCDMFVAI